jgi:hypothetical protein
MFHVKKWGCVKDKTNIQFGKTIWIWQIKNQWWIKINDFIVWIKCDASFKWYGLEVQKP